MSNTKVKTRFAPSPTGALHVGGARTALFSWAFARGHGGEFILRFEDTDQKRSSEQSAQSILDDLTWLGINWDNPPDDDIPRQSQRLDLYTREIERLLSSGQAFEDDGAVRFRVDDDLVIEDAVYGRVEVKAVDVEDFVIRKADGFPTFHLAVVVDDADMGITHVIRGQEHLSNTPKHVALIDALGYERPVFAHTPSIMNPDGSKMSKRDKAKCARAATQGYLSELSDSKKEQFYDSLESIDRAPTNMLPERLRRHRGIPQDVDHLFQAGEFREFVKRFLDKENDEDAIAELLANQLSISLPEIAVSDFRDSGYLPGALCNYLSLLGWNPGGDVEQFDMAFLCEKFSLDRINKSNSKFDRDKLRAFNADAIAALPPEDFAKLLAAHDADLAGQLGDRFNLFAQAYQPRARTLSEPAETGRFFLIGDDDVKYKNEKAINKNLKKNDGEGLTLLGELRELLAAIEPWSGEKAHDVINQLSETRAVKMGKVAQPLRVALTSQAVSPPIDITLDILGKTSTLARIDRCLRECSS